MKRYVGIILFLLFFASAALPCRAEPASETKGITRLGFTIQVGAFTEVGNAERLTSRLQARGIDAFYFRRDNRLYAVRFGDYRTREEARRAARHLQDDKVIGSYFIASPQDTIISSGTGTELRQDRSAPRAKAERDLGAIAARTAERFVGIPYQWGGTTVVEGMDCSGFVRAVYNLCGLNIPRTSKEQYRVGDNVSQKDLRDGDLVFFGSTAESINHVGIYIGNGRFVHAPRRGDDIKISTLDESYFSKKFMGGRRYF